MHAKQLQGSAQTRTCDRACDLLPILSAFRGYCYTLTPQAVFPPCAVIPGGISLLKKSCDISTKQKDLQGIFVKTISF